MRNLNKIANIVIVLVVIVLLATVVIGVLSIIGIVPGNLIGILWVVIIATDIGLIVFMLMLLDQDD